MSYRVVTKIKYNLFTSLNISKYDYGRRTDSSKDQQKSEEIIKNNFN